MKCPSHKKHVVDMTTAGMNVIEHEERLLVHTPNRESSAGLRYSLYMDFHGVVDQVTYICTYILYLE